MKPLSIKRKNNMRPVRRRRSFRVFMGFFESVDKKREQSRLACEGIDKMFQF